jgi:hypothetical protein
MFGAAWKILDILIEHALRNMARAKKYYKISEKVEKVRAGVVSVQPLAGDPDLWARVRGAYVGAEEYRHSIVHRRVTTGPNGEFIGRYKNDVPLRGLAVDEQMAFCRVVQRVAACVISGDVSERERRAIGAELDRISALTGLPTRHVQAPAEVIPRITVPVASTVEIDMKDVKRKLYGDFALNPEIDVIFLLTDQADLSFLCHLEEAPDQRLFFSDAASHGWLQRL